MNSKAGVPICTGGAHLDTLRLSPSQAAMASCLEAMWAATMPAMEAWTCSRHRNTLAVSTGTH